MRLRLTACLCGLLLAVVLVLAGAALASAPPRAQLQGFNCHRGLDPVNRSVAVTAVMRPLAGTRHLALRFDLLYSRGGRHPMKVVRAGDLGVWITPRDRTLGQLPGDTWNLQKSVIALAAPATYRFRVQFRWEDQRRHVLGTTLRYSHRCLQRELRPDLLVRSIQVNPIVGQPARELYTAVIANDGNSPSGPFDVLFDPRDGSAASTVTLGSLAAHSTRTERFVGPVCVASRAPIVTADSAEQVDDLNRSNNTMQATCPGPGSG